MTERVLIDRVAGYLRLAIVRDGRLDDLVIEPENDPAPAPADIYLGRVRRVLPGLNAAFVDLGFGPDGFLKAAAALPGGKARSRDDGALRISDLVTEGQALTVQVRRPATADKGPVVSADLALAGRYVVLRPESGAIAISARIEDRSRREALDDAIAPLAEEDGVGFVVRTAAAAIDAGALAGEAETLVTAWRDIAARRKSTGPPARLYRETPALKRLLCDLAAPGACVVAEAVPGFRLLSERLAALWPDLAGRFDPWTGAEPLFEAEGVADDIGAAGEAEIALPAGGRLIFERTHALTAIDVDTGGASGDGGPGRMALDVNLAAAAEIGRQLRLRNVGGLVVIDFVHLRGRRDRDRVSSALADALVPDRAALRVLPMSALGLIEMSRERGGRALADLPAGIAAAGGGAL